MTSRDCHGFWTKLTGVIEATEVSEVTAAETVCPLPPLSLSVEAD